MRTFLLLLGSLVAILPASGQTSLEEGGGSWIESWPLHVSIPASDGAVTTQLHGAYAYRLTNRLDAHASASYSYDRYLLGAGVGFLNVLGDSGWRLRARLDALRSFDAHAPEGPDPSSFLLGQIEGGLFKQIRVLEKAELYPGAELYASVSDVPSTAALGLVLRAPFHYSLSSNILLTASPLYPILLRPELSFPRSAGIAIGAILK